jgi:UDP-glucose 4-epimerase
LSALPSLWLFSRDLAKLANLNMHASTSRVLVTGGAGYIGSHLAHALVDRGYEVHVLDDLSRGKQGAIPQRAHLHRVSVLDSSELHQLLTSLQVAQVFHFAGLIDVAESTRKPDLYMEANTQGTQNLIDALAATHMRVPPIVFSSTAAVYESADRQLKEDDGKGPVSPYGESKLQAEARLRHYALGEGNATISGRPGRRVTVLRYFNAAGAAWGLRENHDPETHLIPLAIDAACGRRPELSVFGNDFPTRDGTCERDYVHVVDLAEAHLRAMEAMLQQDVSSFETYNVGRGVGSTVREVLSEVERVLGVEVPQRSAPRRPGDSASLVADVSKIRTRLGFVAQYDLQTIIRDAAESRK